MGIRKRVLTAAEGADLVAAMRLEGKTAQERQRYLYNCASCGSHNFSVVYQFDDEKTITETLPCTCDNSLDCAAIREILVTRSHTRTGTLTGEHRVTWGESDFETNREEVDLTVECRDCFNGEDNTQWVEDNEGKNIEELEDSQYWEVHCESCGHEIEFGWSHPDRGGRIWPCESADFNPWKTVPEPRFVEVWKKRGWLRPSGRK